MHIVTQSAGSAQSPGRPKACLARQRCGFGRRVRGAARGRGRAFGGPQACRPHSGPGSANCAVPALGRPGQAAPVPPANIPARSPEFALPATVAAPPDRSQEPLRINQACEGLFRCIGCHTYQ
jgi:hypothetical protein